jgi:hypothetical protein
LARTYYFWKSDLTTEERERRQKLFGGFKEGMKPVKPYYWQVNSDARLLEIPITTIPIIKTPFHLSYLLYIGRFSLHLMSMYFETALALCRMTHVEPSFLLHPLDLLSGEQIPELAFFPGMDLNSERKAELFTKVIIMLSNHYNLVNMSTHADSILKGDGIKVVQLS